MRTERKEGGGKIKNKRDGDKSREKQDVRTEIQKNKEKRWQRDRERGRSRASGLGALLCKNLAHDLWSQTLRVQSLVGYS